MRAPDAEPPLDAFPSLAGARILCRLGGGPSSESWLLKAPDGRMVLRRDRPLAARLGLDRVNELDILTAVGRADFGPAVVDADPARGLLVTRYLGGTPWRPSDLREPWRLRALGRLLRRVHDLPPAGKPFDPAGIAAHYARQAGGREARRLAREAKVLADRLYPEGLERRLCHHDPHAANVAGRRPVRLLDWEYAAAGQPLMDLAVVARFHRLGAGRLSHLVSGWHQSGQSRAVITESVLEFGRLYDLLAALWARVVSGW